MTRLTQERDTLLSTGLYSMDDRVINIIQKALDLQTQRLRKELLKKESRGADLLSRERTKPSEPSGATGKPQKPKVSTISKKAAKFKSAPKTRPK